MTAITYRDYTLLCDFALPDGGPCKSQYGPGESRSALRKAAAKEGWTFVRSDIARRLDLDFCAAHKPGAAA